MSENMITNPATSEPSTPATPATPERAPRVLSVKPRVAKMEPTGPVPPKPLNATDAANPVKVREFIKAMRDFQAALIASKPRGTKQPVISDAIKEIFFSEPGISNEDCRVKAAKKLGLPLSPESESVKLVTVKTFRGDAVNTFKNAAAAGMLSPAGKRWLELNRRK